MPRRKHTVRFNQTGIDLLQEYANKQKTIELFKSQGKPTEEFQKDLNKIANTLVNAIVKASSMDGKPMYKYTLNQHTDTKIFYE